MEKLLNKNGGKKVKKRENEKIRGKQTQRESKIYFFFFFFSSNFLILCLASLLLDRIWEIAEAATPPPNWVRVSTYLSRSPLAKINQSVPKVLFIPILAATVYWKRLAAEVIFVFWFFIFVLCLLFWLLILVGKGNL